MSEKFTEWEEFRKELNITPEEELEIQFEEDIIKALIKAEANNKFTKMGVNKDKYIGKVDRCTYSTHFSALIQLLYPLGYTLKVVPLEQEK